MARAPALQQVEELPEADRLEGFPHPRHTRALFGHEATEGMLAAAFAGGRLHHAWLLTGAEGIGKATLAYRFARHVLAEPAERGGNGGALEVGEETRTGRQVRSLSHPGLLVLRRPYDVKAKRFPVTIPIDEVRRLRSFFALRAEGAAWRVVIVDRADEFNVAAANALLKSLEEPPARTLFLLVSSAPGGLLPTIRSRCRTLALAPLASAPLRRAVLQALAASGRAEPQAAEWPALERLAEGSVRRALALLASGGLELNARLLGLLAGLPAVDWTQVHGLAEELAPSAAEQRLELFFELLLGLLARLVRAAATGAGDPEEMKLVDRLCAAGRLASMAELWETLAREKAEALELNLDRKSLVLGTFSRLETAARG
jgi:DNA polymerase III subunit delta'